MTHKQLIFGDPESIAYVRKAELIAEFNSLPPCKSRQCAKSSFACEGEGKQHGAFFRFKDKHPSFNTREAL
jgi:hypothetical protein